MGGERRNYKSYQRFRPAQIRFKKTQCRSLTPTPPALLLFPSGCGWAQESEHLTGIPGCPMSIWEITVSREHPYVGRNFLEVLPASRNVQMSDPESASAILSAVRRPQLRAPGPSGLEGISHWAKACIYWEKQFLF